MKPDKIKKLQQRAIDLQGKKDGSFKICPSPSVITFAKTHGKGQARVPREAEKKVRKWCAAFRPVEGSRGMRTERVLTRFFA